MKIQELITSYDSIIKKAFVPNPEAQGADDQLQQAYDQLSQVLQSAGPEVQAQVQPMLQQLQQLPPQEQLGQITSLVQQLSGQSAGGSAPQQQQETAQSEPAPESEQGHLNAENSLDNTKVTLSVRELLDLSSGGKATQSLLKVKQMAEAHNRKMEATQQQAEQDQAMQQQQQQQGAMAQGGIYSQPMNAAPPKQ